MTLRDIGLALMAVVPDCYHFEALKKPDKYIVWAEDSQGDTLWADGKMRHQSIQGTVDYFTRDEYDPTFMRIQQALNGVGVSWSLNSIQYEDTTRYTHYEWTFDMAGDGLG